MVQKKADSRKKEKCKIVTINWLRLPHCVSIGRHWILQQAVALLPWSEDEKHPLTANTWKEQKKLAILPHQRQRHL